MGVAKMDENSRQTLTALASDGSGEVVPLYANKTTHRLLIDASGGGAGITSINGDVTQAQLIVAASTGTDFTITTALGTTTVAIPSASATARGLVTTGTQTIAGAKTFSTAPILSSLTASQLLALDGSNNIQTLTVATYPSLTEISYVKGVTSSIQTQFTGKQATLVSGTNIKTVNGTTLLGSGDLATPQGTVTAVSIATANGVSGSSSGGATPALTITLGAITPSTVNGNTITTGTGTLTLGAGSTLATSATNSITLTSTGATNVTLPTTGTLATLAGTETLTNKRVTPRILSAASYTTDTGTSINGDTLDMFIVTAQTGALKFNNPTGTPTDGQKLILTVASSTTAARALTWDTAYGATTVALPTTTAATTATLTIGFIWSASKSLWQCVAVA